MNKKLTDREQATREYYKVLARFKRAKRPSTIERLIPELDAAFERIPPDSKRQNIRSALKRSDAAKQMDLAGARLSILPALTKDNVEPFFRAVELLSDVFADTEIMENTLVVWMENRLSKNARGKFARKNLKRLAKILTNIHGAPEYETEEERVAARRARERVKSKEYYDRKKNPPG